MNKKIIGVLVITLLIAIATVPIVGSINIKKDLKAQKEYDSSDTELKWMKAGDALRSLRSYWLHVPPNYDESEPVSLVIVLHGAIRFIYYDNPLTLIYNWFTSCSLERYTKMSEKADEEGFIVVYPNGKLLYDDYEGLVFEWDVNWMPDSWIRGRKYIDDVGFFRELIDEIENNYNIDSNRIYISGISYGADMTYFLGSELSDVVAAISPVAGGTVGGKWEDEEEYTYIPVPDNPVSVIVFHATDDYYDGGSFEGFEWLGCIDSLLFWVEHNNCETEPIIEESESGKIIKSTYPNGDEGSEVVLYTVVNGGHWWFGSPSAPACEISATDLIWEFFEQHPKQ
jgi:polyhydroxybutyrate depolymerase